MRLFSPKKPQNHSKIQAGDFCYDINNLKIRSWGEDHRVRIGSFCSFADDITIFLGGNHRADWATTYPFGHVFTDVFGHSKLKGHPASNGDVTIGNDVWVGSHATLMSGVTIADGAIIAANAHVVADVESYAIVGGNPAKHLKYRFDEPIRQRLLKLAWWELGIDQINEIKTALLTPPSVKLLDDLIMKYRS